MKPLKITTTKRRIRKIIKNPKNNPVLIDTNMFTYLGNNLFEILQDKKLPEVNLRTLKEARKYVSFNLRLIDEEAKILSVPSVVEEINVIIDELKRKSERIRQTYDFGVRDSIMRKARSKKRVLPETLSRISEIKSYISRLERISEVLGERSKRYEKNNPAIELIARRVNDAANVANTYGNLEKISDADTDLVIAAFYEAILFENTPFILSNDRDINEIIWYSLNNGYFHPTEKRLIEQRVKIYRKGRRKNKS